MQLISKSTKLELYYIRQMLHDRYKPRWWRNYILNRFFSLQLLARMEPISCDKEDDFELHILTPRSGLWMAYWAIRSFMHHSDLCPRVIVHDDGSIDDKAKAIFESKLSNARIIQLKEADIIFYNNPNIPDLIKYYRKIASIFILSFVDHLFLSSSQRVMIMDNDMLFYSHPTEVIDFMRGTSGVDAIYAAYSGNNPVDMDEYYKKKYASILDDASRLNSGLMVFDKSKIDVQRIAEYFEHITKPDGSLIEQTGWGMILSQVPHAFFSEELYKLRGGIEPPTIAKHFTTPRRYEMFAYGIDAVRKCLGA